MAYQYGNRQSVVKWAIASFKNITIYHHCLYHPLLVISLQLLVNSIIQKSGGVAHDVMCHSFGLWSPAISDTCLKFPDFQTIHQSLKSSYCQNVQQALVSEHDQGLDVKLIEGQGAIPSTRIELFTVRFCNLVVKLQKQFAPTQMLILHKYGRKI